MPDYTEPFNSTATVGTPEAIEAWPVRRPPIFMQHWEQWEAGELRTRAEREELAELREQAKLLLRLANNPMTDHSMNPTSRTGHVWPCTGFYELSTKNDRTERCTCGANARLPGAGGDRRKRWPMWLGWLGARTGRAVSEDVAGRYQPVTVYQRPASKVRQLLGIGAWVAAVGYVVAWLTNSRILIDAVDWVRQAPAEQVAGGTIALVIFWSSAKLIGLGIRVGQRRYRYVYVTSTEAGAMRAPEALVFRTGKPGRGTSVDLREG